MHAKVFPVTLLLLSIAMTATAQQTPDVLTLDINAVIKRLADEMDKEFIVDPRLVGATGRSSTSVDDANYETLLGVLRSLGYVATEVGDQIRIVPEQIARSEPSPIVQEDDSRISDHAVVTRIIDVSDIRLPDAPDQEGTPASAASVLQPVLRPLMSTSIGNIVSVPGTRKIIITDRYDNVRRISAIVDELRQ